MSELVVAPDLARIVRPGVLHLEDVVVVEHDPRLDAALAHLEVELRQTGDGDTARAARLEAVRTMYKQVGLDPTRRRPSSEALLRRVRRGEPLPRVNSVVDVCNWCSVEFQLPYGLYDAAHIEGAVTLRLGRDGESYAGIRKDDVHVGGRITLADARGPFGNPTSDSARTMVTPATRRVLLVVFAPVSVGSIDGVLATTAARMREYAGGYTTA